MAYSSIVSIVSDICVPPQANICSVYYFNKKINFVNGFPDDLIVNDMLTEFKTELCNLMWLFGNEKMTLVPLLGG